MNSLCPPHSSDMDFIYSNGSSILHRAAEKSNSRCLIRMLMKLLPNQIDALDANGESPLSLALRASNKVALSELVGYEAYMEPCKGSDKPH